MKGEAHSDPNRLTIEQRKAISGLLKLDLPEWMRDGLESMQERDCAAATLSIDHIIGLIEFGKTHSPQKSKKPGRPSKRSINEERAEAVWCEFPQLDRADGEDENRTIAEVIGSLQNEAAALPADHRFRLAVERLFPKTTSLDRLHQSTSTGLASAKKRHSRMGAVTWDQMTGLNSLRDFPHYRGSNEDFEE